MVKVRPTMITLELERSGQKITVDLKEAKEMIKTLSKFVEEDSNEWLSSRRDETKKGGSKKRKSRNERTKGSRQSIQRTKSKISHMSDAKKHAILDHVHKQLSNKPKTLSNMLKGISYVPNYLPAIRQMVEIQPHIVKQTIGKRTFYLIKSAENRKAEKPSKVTAAAA